MKIYDTDSEVYARTTKISPIRTKGEIDGLLARFGIRDVWWRFDIVKDKGVFVSPSNDVFLKFILPSERFGRELTVQIDPPRIWHKHSKGDYVNWQVSIRNMYWYILTHLSQAYVNQSSKFTEFLPHILGVGGKKLVDVIGEEMLALPKIIEEERRVHINEC